MKAKHIVPIIAGGILGTGAAVFAYSEIKRLKGIISDGEEYRKKQGDCIRSLGEVIEEKNEEIAELNRVVYDKDTVIALQEEVIASHEKRMSILQKSQELSEEPEPTTEPISLADDSSGDMEPPKKQVYKPEYIFQYDSDFKVIGKYKSAAEACDKAGIQYAGNLRKVFAGVNATAAGYFWSKGTKPLKQFPARWIKAADSMKKRELERAKNEKEEN